MDGVPPGFELSENDIQPNLTRRRPGQSIITTTRDEKDKVEILSGVENGVTLGSPIGLYIPNENIRPQDYYDVLSVPRPGVFLSLKTYPIHSFPSYLSIYRRACRFYISTKIWNSSV